MESGSKRMQYLSGILGSFSVMAAGVTLSWSSPATAKLNADNPTVWEDSPVGPLTIDEISWIGSLLTIGAIIGPWIAIFLADRLGRKITLLITAIIFCVGWILIGTTKTVAQIYVARILCGLGVGIVYTILPMYLGEIGEDDIRGALGSFLQLFVTIGVLYSYVIGPYVSWLVLALTSLIIPIIFGVTFIFMPESPMFYILKGRKNDALKSLMRLRGKTAFEVENELNEMEASMAETMKQKGGFLDLFATIGTRKALVLSLGLVMFQQLCGIEVIVFYTEDIFKATGSDISPAIAAMAVALVQVLASFVTPFVVDRLGRRILLIVSGIGMAISLGLLGMFFFLNTHSPDVANDIGVLPIVCLVLYMCVYSIGFGPLPWAILGELFPANVKSIASTCTASFCWLLAFFLTKYFKYLSEEVGFWMFSVSSLIATVFVFILLPETKNKSLQEIQDMLNGKM